MGLADGTLVMAYSDAVEDNPSHYVYELQADVERSARDIFTRTCNYNLSDCTSPADWTGPDNISNTALRFSINTDWTGDTDGSSARTAFHGDSPKPNIFSAGTYVVVTWTDQYCSSGAQRTVTDRDRNNREVPFSCVYAAHASGSDVVDGVWTVKRLSDGSRDANQDVSRGMQNDGWAIIWQEDPRGLQPGEAEGPDDGASGARVSFGTDIWYTSTAGGGQFGVWANPNRLTDN